MSEHAIHYTPAMFGDLSNSTIDSLMTFIGTVANITTMLSPIRLIIVPIGLALNIIHLIILCKKSMRANVINLIMIGIAIFDLTNLLFSGYGAIHALIEDICNPHPLWAVVLSFCGGGISNNARRLTTWFAFFMTFLRYFILRNAMNHTSERFSEPSFAFKTMTIGFVISAIISFLSYGMITFGEGEMDMIPSPICGGNFTGPLYSGIPWSESVGWDSAFQANLSVFDGILTLIPVCLMPVFTILLIGILTEAKKNRQRLSNNHKKDEDRTTTLVIMISIIFILAMGPYGIGFFVRGILAGPEALIMAVSDLLALLDFFFILNGVSHFFVCVSISTPYQKEMKQLFGIEKPLFTKHVIPKSQVSSIGSVTISRNVVEIN